MKEDLEMGNGAGFVSKSWRIMGHLIVTMSASEGMLLDWQERRYHVIICRCRTVAVYAAPFRLSFETIDD
jgi:hypothetical protein